MLLRAIMIEFIPEEIFNKCRTEAENLWANGKPKSWYFVIQIILIWIVLVYIIFKVAIA